jgi:hypothetical protein
LRQDCRQRKRVDDALHRNVGERKEVRLVARQK